MKIDFERLEREINDGTIERRIEERNKKIEKLLNEKGISNYREEKENWGTIIVFELKGKKVFSYNFKKKDQLSVYYYSNEYSCSPCRIKI